jgi:hypothetical protein
LTRLPLARIEAISTDPTHREHHFVYDRTKYAFYSSTCYTVLGDNDRAEEHTLDVIAQHTCPDGSTNAPMRIAHPRWALGSWPPGAAT